ncbi:MAG: geranylgeranyl reductase family protein [Bacteroidetes bacterium]|nr:geranylgeranyl reductase family protein [Bacteroidota bacterium]
MHSQVVIIGAGPAGCSTSLFLSKHKIPHLILEQSTFPRDKICGDALSGKVVEVLKKYDENLIHQMTQDPTHFLGSWGVKFVAPNGKALDIPFKQNTGQEPHAPGFICRRMHFDHFMVQQLDTSYAQLITGAEVISMGKADNINSVTYTNQGVVQTTSFDIIVGCDGDRSIVEKTFVNRSLEPDHYCAGIRAYYKNVTELHPQNFIELHFLDELLPGYLWIFPLGDGTCNVGAGMLSSSVSKNKVNLREQMLKAIAENPNLKKRFANAQLEGKINGWGLPLGSKKRSISGHHYILTGDAASLIDPFTGEGIGNALYSGFFAAQAIQKAIEHKNFSAPFLALHYDNPVYERLWSELKLSHSLQKLSKYNRLFNFVVNRAHKSTTLRNTISSMFEDMDLRAQFRNPVFWWKMMIGK